MRCLRCAIDYPPGERFCRRCGRGLSYPPGSREAQESTDLAALQDTQYVYSTYSPPASDDVEPGASDTVLPPARPVGLPPSMVLARPPLGKRAGATLLPPGSTGAEPAPESEYGGQFDGTGVFIAPPSSDETATWPPGTEAAVAADERLNDEEGVLAAFRPKPATIGQDSSWRVRRPRRQRGMPSALKLSRRLLVAVVVVILLLVAVVVALLRHGTYTSDLQQARQFVRGGDYQAALGKYADAIGAWPLNSDAKREQAGIQATAVAVQSTATAVAVQAQAQVTAAAQRKAIYGARSSLRRQIAGQADADAIATATAVAAATPGH